MAKTVSVPGVGDVDFPDSMSHEEIIHAIETDILPHVEARGAEASRATPAAPTPSVADLASQRLAARGTSASQIKERAAAGKPIAPEDPSPLERLGADTASTISGTGQFMAGVVAGIPEQAYNIATAVPRSAAAAVAALKKGGSLSDAGRAAAAVQPHRELSELVGAASEDARKTIRGALGVRPGTIVPQEDIMEQVPGLIGVIEGGVKTAERFSGPRAATEVAPSDSGHATAATPPAADLATMTPDQLRAHAEALQRQLHESDVVPGVGNRRAWNQIKGSAQHVASVDVDNLKTANDVHGHLAGDALISANGEALRIAADEHGAEVAHISGDEFKIAAKDAETLHKVRDRARQIVAEGDIMYLDPSGAEVPLPKDLVKGFSYGIGKNEAAAEVALKADKAARLETGLRTERRPGPTGELAERPDLSGQGEAGREIHSSSPEVADGVAPPSDPPPGEPPPTPPSDGGQPSNSSPAGNLPPVQSSEYGSALRTLFTGERDTRVAEANNLADDIRRTLPDHLDQEALTILRDFRNKPGQLAAFLDGTHPAYDGMTADAKGQALARVDALRPVIDRAANPSPAMQAADAALSRYFDTTLQEGRDLGFLESTRDPEEYINHLLQPKDPKLLEKSGSGLRQGRIGRFTQFAKRRFYPTVLDAVADGVEPRTLNAADAVSIYGDKHGTAAATRTLINVLKESSVAKWGSDRSVPQGWAEIGRGTRLFRNEVPFMGTDGEAQVAHQALYAPKDIAEAINPLTDPDGSSTIPGFTKTKLYQAYLKSVELGLSVFHIRALNLTALGNEGISGLVDSYKADMTSPQFRGLEKTFLEHGGTTSITGRTLEAYRAARPASIPTRIDVIRQWPVLKQFDRVAEATSRITFDVMQRKFKVTDFALKDAKWIAEHQDATPRELAAARRSIAKEINAVYGGLNWEALGINRLTHSMLKAVFLAPDWTFSNFQNVATAATRGPGGAAARAFWLRSAVTGVALTQLTSLILSGEMSDDWTQAYLGKDRDGKKIYQNLYFAGAPSDFVSLMKNVQDYGAIVGTAHTIAGKLAPIARTGVQLLTNRNYLGQEIAKRGGGFEGDVRTAGHLGSQLLPAPFSVSNIVQMLTDPEKEYTPTEYATTLLSGTRPRHVTPTTNWRARKGAN